MGKVFGYPEFDEKGEKILTTYDNDYKDMMMDIRVYRMKAGETRTFGFEGEETAVLLLEGKITFSWDDQKAQVSRGKVYLQKDPGAFMCVPEQKFLLPQIQRQRFWCRGQKMRKNFQENSISRRMLPGVIPVWENLGM